MSAAFPPGLLLVTDRRSGARPLEDTVAAALDAGFAAVMLREKDLPGGPLLRIAEGVAARCRDRGRPLIVNDRLDVALALGDAGAHVGAGGIPVADARRLLGPARPLGYSAHAVDEAARALDDGADYVTLSPIFPSATKPALLPRGAAFLAAAARALPEGRVIALGGITATTAPEARAAGAAGAAVLGAVNRADDPAAAARRIVAAWRAAV